MTSKSYIKHIQIDALILIVFILLAAVSYSAYSMEKEDEALTAEQLQQEEADSSLQTESSSLTAEAEETAAESSDTADQYSGFIQVAAEIPSDDDTQAQSSQLYLKGEECYLFLPSYFDDSGITLDFNEGSCSVSWNGTALASGETISLPGDDDSAVIHITDQSTGVDADYTFRVMKSENMAAIYITTANHTLDWINADKENWEPGTYLCMDDNGVLDSSAAIRKIHTHGFSTYNGVGYKNSYRMNLQEAADVLSLGSYTSWILQSNNEDATKVRNETAYALAESLGMPYTTDRVYADVYFNGSYDGNFMIIEPIEVAADRVNLPEGSILLRKDRTEEDLPIVSAGNGVTYNVLYPEDISDEEVQDLSERIQEIWQLADECTDDAAYAKLENLIDIDSFARLYLMNFLTNEPDSNSLSSYYYLDSTDGKIHAGPVWDYDRAFGNDNSFRENYQGLDAYIVGTPEKLMHNDQFLERVKAIAEDHDFASEITGHLMETYQNIAASEAMDETIWGHAGGIDSGDISSNLEYACQKIHERCALLDEILNDRQNWCCVTLHIGENSTVAYEYWVKKGDMLSQDVLDFVNSLVGGYRWFFKDASSLWPQYTATEDIDLYTHTDADVSSGSSDG